MTIVFDMLFSGLIGNSLLKVWFGPFYNLFSLYSTSKGCSKDSLFIEKSEDIGKALDFFQWPLPLVYGGPKQIWTVPYLKYAGQKACCTEQIEQ